MSVPMPRKFVDYWLEHPKTWKVDTSVPCDYCQEPIVKGDHYFTLYVGPVAQEGGELTRGVEKRGHLRHLVYADPVPWKAS